MFSNFNPLNPSKNFFLNYRFIKKKKTNINNNHERIFFNYLFKIVIVTFFKQSDDIAIKISKYSLTYKLAYIDVFNFNKVVQLRLHV